MFSQQDIFSIFTLSLFLLPSAILLPTKTRGLVGMFLEKIYRALRVYHVYFGNHLNERNDTP